jgi:serine protease
MIERWTYFSLRALVAAAAMAGGWAYAGGGQLPAMGMQAALADTTDQLVVTYRSGALSADMLTDVLSRHAVQAVALRGDKLRLNRRISHDEADRLAADLKAGNPLISDAYADRWATIQAVPNDPMWSQQWHYHEKIGGINLVKAWKKSTGAGVVVAVLDTGYRPHADLVANIVAGYDMIVDTGVSNDGDGRDADAQDPGDGCGGQSSWHGTHTAGTVAATTNNGIGVAGVAKGAKVQPVRVLGCGGGYFSDIQDGITWASGGSVAGVPANPTPAKVISMSLSGGGACPQALQTVINAAVARGTIVIAAAGNNSGNAGNYTPANCANVVTVAATNRAGAKAWYSNTGAVVEIAAPGGDTTVTANGVLSTLNAGYSNPGADSYAFYQGTSMATPHVAGVAALVMSKYPAWTPAQVQARLQSSARAFPGACNLCGSGIVDAGKAVK